MATIKITDDRQGRSFRTGVNGKFFDLPVNQETQVDDLLLDHLRTLGVAFDEVASERGAGSKEGSVDLAPIGPHDVSFPGTATKSLNTSPTSGDQPGDVVEGGVAFGGTIGQTIEDAARISDIRVAAERRSATDGSVSVAELAGEGELGTKATEPAQGIEPSHVDEEPAEKKAAPRRKASK